MSSQKIPAKEHGIWWEELKESNILPQKGVIDLENNNFFYKKQNPGKNMLQSLYLNLSFSLTPIANRIKLRLKGPDLVRFEGSSVVPNYGGPVEAIDHACTQTRSLTQFISVF